LINRLIFRTIYLVNQENHDNCKIQLNQFTNSNTVNTNKQFISSHFSSGFHPITQTNQWCYIL